MNKNKIKLLVQASVYFMLFILIAIPLAVEAKDMYTRLADGRIERITQEHIKLDNLSGISEKKLDLNNFNSAPPRECLENLTFCEETTEIIVTTKKVWKPIKLASITSKELRGEDFGKYYPSLKSDKIINASSSNEERLMAQRILYEVGLLPVLPTGKLGSLTEIATLKLQCAAGFEEFGSNGRTIIGEKTIEKLKELKERVADPVAISNRPVPNRDFSTCSPAIQKRANEIEYLMGLVSQGKLSGGSTTPQSNSQNINISKLRFLNLAGEAIIKKQ